MKIKGNGLIKEFKEFIARGNVLDMAVGVIMGSAFTAIVTSLVEDIFTPIIGMITGGINFAGLKYVVPIPTGEFEEDGITPIFTDGATLTYGNFIQNIITFLLTAICVFAIVKVVNKFLKKKESEPAPEPTPEPSKEEVLLTEMLEIMKANAEHDGIDIKKVLDEKLNEEDSSKVEVKS
ncbi:MAG: large-conductance mechanosensitive channel protein MscL [Ruminococcus sp.]|nr:large-conductance mechanosensitive channel protein MscL [Ruminococcus sp.]